MPPCRSPGRTQLADLRPAIQAPMTASTPMTALTEPRMSWLPWLTLPLCPIVFSGPRPTPAKNSMARMMNRTPTTASAMTRGRFGAAAPETVDPSCSFGGRESPGAVGRLREGGISRWPGGRPAGRGDNYVPQRTTCGLREKATSGKRPKAPPEGSPRRALLPPLPARAEEVADYVFAQAVGHRAQHPAAVSPGDLVYERDQPLIVSEHEHIQRRPPPRHLVYLGHRQLERFRRWRPVEPETAIPAQVRCRLAVGDDQHNRIVLGSAVEEATGEHQRVMQVSALHHVPAEPSQIRLPEFPRVVGESDDLQRVLREPRPDQ